MDFSKIKNDFASEINRQRRHICRGKFRFHYPSCWRKADAWRGAICREGICERSYNVPTRTVKRFLKELALLGETLRVSLARP